MILERPKIEAMAFRLYDRPIHPELFVSVAERTVRHGDTTLIARITPTGHVLEWHRKSEHFVEVTTTNDHELPDGQRIALPFQGERRGHCTQGQLRYQMSLQAEILPAEVFLHIHDELISDGASRGLLFHFAPHNRFALVPIGLIVLDPVPHGMSLSTFHTFPAECAILKTQSLFEIHHE